MSVVQSEAVRGLLHNTVVWDNHGCLPKQRTDVDAYMPALERYRRAGVNVVSINVADDAAGPWHETMRVLARFRAWLSARPEQYLLVRTVDDIVAAKAAGQLAVTFDIEGGTAIDDELGLIRLYWDLGVRWMLVAYNRNNRLGGGCYDEDTGLTAFGRAVQDEMERLGMAVCCSHTGRRTSLEVMERATKPVLLSHSNPSALYPHKRNVPDELIRACARTGGVVGINGIGIFLGDNDNRTETIVRHIRYVADLVGTDHVSLALDYLFDLEAATERARRNPGIWPASDGYGRDVKLVAPEQIPEIAEQLLQSGFAADDVAKIMGANLMRIARETWTQGASR